MTGRREEPAVRASPIGPGGTGQRWGSLLDVRRHVSFGGVMLRDALGVPRLSRRPDREHLRAAMQWLCRAQDVTGCGGVSGGYGGVDGWLSPYPETTGYTIETFLEYADLTGGDEYLRRAIRMGDWELSIQLPEGAVRGGIGLNADPIVFNTGQVALGWAVLAARGHGEKYLEGARRAADWLISIQDDDGKWSRHVFENVPHAYHSRVAWPILDMYQQTHEDKYRTAAERHVHWVLGLANDNGWFTHMSFKPGEWPFTHTIAYTLRGLFECARRLDGPIVSTIDDAVEKSCERILLRYERRKRDPRGMPAYLPGTLDENWRSKDAYSCLTGNVQIAIVFLKLFELRGDPRYLNAALKLIDQVKATQSLTALNGGIRGAVAGSHPIWRGYHRLGYPNWAAKFLADAIMLADKVVARLEQPAS